MIELDQTAELYVREFGRFVDKPTHAEMCALRYGLPPDKGLPKGYEILCAPHVEAIYVFGRIDENGEFYQTDDDARHQAVHAGVDLTEYDTQIAIGTEGQLMDSAERLEFLADQERKNAIRWTLLSPGMVPHPDNPAEPMLHEKRRRNRFSERDLDVVFSHCEASLLGKAIV